MKHDTEVEIIGVDHGYKNMKTSQHFFRSAIMELPDLPEDMEGILEYKDRIFTIYGIPLASTEFYDKSDSEEFYLLTLVCMAKELKSRGKRTAHVRIAAGLPQKWYLSQKNRFAKSLGRNKELHFTFEGIPYHAYIDHVSVWPQEFAAYMAQKELCSQSSYFVIVDIGGETFDVIPIRNRRIVQDECRIDTRATIWLMNEISESIEADLYESINENVLLDLMLSGKKDGAVKNRYEEIIRKKVTDYSGYVFTRLKEMKINLELTPIVFAGGGGILLQQYGTYREDQTHFITDIRANAKGYELIDRHCWIKGRKT